MRAARPGDPTETQPEQVSPTAAISCCAGGRRVTVHGECSPIIEHAKAEHPGWFARYELVRPYLNQLQRVVLPRVERPPWNSISSTSQ
jgi:hypothetical protein